MIVKHLEQRISALFNLSYHHYHYHYHCYCYCYYLFTVKTM